MEIDLDLLARRLKEARKQAGYSSQEMAAEAVPMSVNTLKDWESARGGPPNVAILAKFASCMQVAVDYLIGRVDNPSGLIAGYMVVNEKKLRKLLSAKNPKDVDGAFVGDKLMIAWEIPQDPGIYGAEDYATIVEKVREKVRALGLDVDEGKDERADG